MGYIKLYEILVPTIHSDSGKPIRTRFHRVWDKKVRDIAKGLTILSPVKGQWVDTKSIDNKLYSERMIPVRVMCDESEIEQIIIMTAKYYKQVAVMYYVISSEVFIKYFGQTST